MAKSERNRHVFNITDRGKRLRIAPPPPLRPAGGGIPGLQPVKKREDWYK